MRRATPRTGISTAQESTSSTSFKFPNVPAPPRNGMIRTYQNDRTFSRPYSAKTVFFYKEADEYFPGLRIPISKSRYRTMEGLLDDLNKNIQMPFGVRRLTTPMGRTQIEELSQLQHLGKYVATSSKYSRGINLSALERLKNARSEAEASLRRQNAGGQSFWIPTSPSYRQKLRMTRTLGINVVPSKQVFVVLNGKGNFYRLLINPLRTPSMDQLLSDISNGLGAAIFRLYSSEGARIETVAEILHLNPPKLIACPRNERPSMRDTVHLPTINPSRYAPRTYGKRPAESTTSHSSTLENGIEKPRGFNKSALKRNTRKTTGAPRKKNYQPLPAIATATVVAAKKPASSLPDETDSGKANSVTNSISSRQTDNSKIEEDDIREKRKASVHSDFEKAEMIRRESNMIDDSSEEDDMIFHEESRPVTAITRNKSASPEPEEEPSDADEGDKVDDLHGERAITVASRRPSRSSRASTSQSQKEPNLPNGNLSRQTTAASDREHDLHNGMSSSKNTARSDYEDDLPNGMHSRNSTAYSQWEDNMPDHLHSSKSTARSHQGRLDDAIGSRRSTARSPVEDNLPSSRIDTAISEREEDLPHTADGARKSTSHSQHEHDLPSASNSRKSTAQSQREEELPDELHGLDSAHSQREVNLPSANGHRDDAVGSRSASQLEDVLQSEDEEEQKRSAVVMLDRDAAAIKIQAAFRGYNTRKKLKKVSFESREGEVLMEDPQLEDEMDDEPKRKRRPQTPREDSTTYTITVMTGYRWGAETEADLHIRLFGDDGTSDIILLPHEDRPWLQAEEPRFRQGQLDLFHVNCSPLGALNKITIGHTKKGYGAGIFIDHVLVTENHVEGRQFVFYVNKWFDSGQVDGKLERTVQLGAFYYVNSIPEEGVVSQGRWELVLFNGKPDGTGGTTSNLTICGYGSEGSSITKVENDGSLQNVPSKTLVQVDFGNIGELLKLRFEIDQAGAKPDYFLDLVELRDLDTDERLVCRVGKWLSGGGEQKRPQAFREVSIFRAGEQPTPLVNYDGRVIPGDTSLLENQILRGELHGDFDSGIFPLIYSKSKKEYTFKMECVSLGRIRKLKIIGDFTEKGKMVMEGLSILQTIYDSHGLNISVAEEVLVSKAFIRDSIHTPYHTILSESQVIELEEDLPYFKTLQSNGMEGLLTRNTKEETPTGKTTWSVSMSVDATVTPKVWLCNGFKAHETKLALIENGILTYEMKNTSLSVIDKIRVGVGELEKGERLYIDKMRLENSLTMEEVRYGNVQTEFHSYQTFEYSTVYPDIPPKLNYMYRVSLHTMEAKGRFQPIVNIIGAEADSAPRILGDKTERNDEPRESYEIEAVNVTDLQKLEVSIAGDENASWTFEIAVLRADKKEGYETDQATIAKPGSKLSLPLKVIDFSGDSAMNSSRLDVE